MIKHDNLFKESSNVEDESVEYIAISWWEVFSYVLSKLSEKIITI